MAINEGDKKVLTYGIFLAVVIVAALLYYNWAIVVPQKKANEQKREKLAKELKDLKRQYTEMLALVNQRDKVKKELAILEEAAKRLPRSLDRFNFFVELSDILQLTGVKYSKITPQKINVKAFYTEIPYVISCLARYHEYGQFLNMIEQNPRRFMRVSSFTINNDQKRPSIHPITVSVSTFMFNK